MGPALSPMSPSNSINTGSHSLVKIIKKNQSPRVRELEESEKLEIGPASGLFSIELKVGISHRFWTETIRAHLWPFTISDR